MSDDLLLKRCPTCGLVKDEMHLYIGHLAYEKKRLVDILVKIGSNIEALKATFDILNEEDREIIVTAIQARDKKEG